MKFRILGKTGVKVSEVGLGTWQLGSADWGTDVSDREALRQGMREKNLCWIPNIAAIGQPKRHHTLDPING